MTEGAAQRADGATTPSFLKRRQNSTSARTATLRLGRLKLHSIDEIACRSSRRRHRPLMIICRLHRLRIDRTNDPDLLVGTQFCPVAIEKRTSNHHTEPGRCVASIETFQRSGDRYACSCKATGGPEAKGFFPERCPAFSRRPRRSGATASLRGDLIQAGLVLCRYHVDRRSRRYRVLGNGGWNRLLLAVWAAGGRKEARNSD